MLVLTPIWIGEHEGQIKVIDSAITNFNLTG